MHRSGFLFRKLLLTALSALLTLQPVAVHSFGYSSTKTTSGQSGTQAVGSQVGAGNNVTILASQDITIAGSQVLAGNDALLSAGRDVTITTAQESGKSWHDSKTSGFGVSVGSKIFAGTTSVKDSVRQDGTTSVGSVISAGNDLTIDAGRNAMISGSWLSAGQVMAISGQQVAIVAADNLQTTKESHKQSQFGVTVGLSGAVGNAVTTAYDTGVRMTQVEDNRLKGALAGQAAYNAYKGVSAWNDYSTAMDKWNQIAPVDQAGLQKPSSPIGLSVSVGGSSSKSERSTSESWATASTLSPACPGNKAKQRIGVCRGSGLPVRCRVGRATCAYARSAADPAARSRPEDSLACARGLAPPRPSLPAASPLPLPAGLSDSSSDATGESDSSARRPAARSVAEAPVASGRAGRDPRGAPSASAP